MVLQISFFVVCSLLFIALTLLLQEKAKVADLNQKNFTLGKSVDIANDRKKHLELVLNEFSEKLVDKRIDSSGKKKRIEKDNSFHGMKRMDHGVLLELITTNPHSGAAALKNWLPYGKHLGKLELIQTFQNIWTKHQKNIL